MVARITRYRIRPGKEKEFQTTIERWMCQLDTLAGFHFFLLLNAEDPRAREVTSISVWDSVENMTSGENTSIYYESVKALIGVCETFSPTHHHDVLKTKFAHVYATPDVHRVP
jgi:heme-degrading monooxygenase HmoA